MNKNVYDYYFTDNLEEATTFLSKDFSGDKLMVDVQKAIAEHIIYNAEESIEHWENQDFYGASQVISQANSKLSRIRAAVRVGSAKEILEPPVNITV